MDKWLAVWHEDECEITCFVLQAAKDASYEDLHQLADTEIIRMLTEAGIVNDYYVDFIINITALCDKET